MPNAMIPKVPTTKAFTSKLLDFCFTRLVGVSVTSVQISLSLPILTGTNETYISSPVVGSTI